MAEMNLGSARSGHCYLKRPQESSSAAPIQKVDIIPREELQVVELEERRPHFQYARAVENRELLESDCLEALGD
jgi:hypothetical protein